MDPDEDPFTAAKREVMEETGISVANMQLEAVLLDIKPVPGESANWLIYHFSADYQSGTLRGTDEGELVWMTKHQLTRERLHPSLKEIIDPILSRRKGTIFVTNTYDPTGQHAIPRHRNECVVRRRGWVGQQWDRLAGTWRYRSQRLAPSTR